jgi:IclR family pca regulon transcriptional regulator
MQISERDVMGGFAKGLRVIEAFSAEHPRLSITQAAGIAELDRATARRCLLTLAELGYARYDGKYFELTPRTLRLGHAYLTATPLPALIQPFLDSLSEKVGQSASASVLDGAEIVYVARAAQRRVMSINLMAGSRLPAYCASMGRVLLSALPEDKARALIENSERRANTPFTKTSPDELMAELARVRSQGYALIDQELEIGLCSIAVPVKDARGRIIAAVNIGVSAAHPSASDMVHAYLESLLDVQRDLQPLVG